MDNKEVKKLQEQLMAKDCEVSQLREEIGILKEELDVWVNPTGEVVMNREGMMLYEASQEENEKLKEQQELLQKEHQEQIKFYRLCPSSACPPNRRDNPPTKDEFIKHLCDENVMLRTEIKGYQELEQELLKKEEAVRSLCKKTLEENEKLKEDNKKFKEQQELLKVGIRKELDILANSKSSYPATRSHTELQKENEKLKKENEELKENEGWWRHQIVKTLGWDEKEGAKWNAPYEHDVKVRDIFETIEDYIYLVRGGDKHDPETGEVIGNTPSLKEIKEENEKLTKELELRDCGSKEEAIARGLMEENEKLKEEVELKKDAWCPELILKDLYENTNYKDPSLTIKDYIQKIEAENEELKKKIEKQDEIILIKDHEYDELKKNLELSEKLVKVEAELFEKVEWVDEEEKNGGEKVWSVGGSGTLPDIFQTEEED